MKKLILICLLVPFSLIVLSQPLPPKKIDRLAEDAMAAFNVPGVAVAVVKDDRVIHLKGYGVRSIATGEKTDEKTLFAIASNTKAFTTAALGILIDEGKLTWDTKVIDIIPEFRLYTRYVTEDFRIRDLLTHRSGLGLGAGDLIMWPNSARFTVADMIFTTSGIWGRHRHSELSMIMTTCFMLLPARWWHGFRAPVGRSLWRQG